MENTLQNISQNLKDLFGLSLSKEKIAKNLSSINEALHHFPENIQNALIIKLISDWKSQKRKDTVTVNTEICRVNDGPCITMFGVLSADWPGLSNNCMGVINEMGYNIYFVKGFSITLKQETLGLIILALRFDSEDDYDQLISNTENIISRLKQAATGNTAKAKLLAEEIGKLEIYSRVIAEIESSYHGEYLEKIIGMNGEASKYFAARSRNYIENRKIEDIADQIIRNFEFIRISSETGTIQVCVKNFITKAEGEFTGMTICGPAHMLNLEDCLKTIELTIPNFQLKHNREFTTDQGISIYRIEFVDPLGHALADVDQKRLEQAFGNLAMNKRRDKAQWIESIGGFEQYARAIIPLLVREATQTDRTQIYHSVTNSAELSIDFKIIGVVAPSVEVTKNFLNHMVNDIDSIPGIQIVAVKPARKFGATQLFIVDLRASLAIIENIESIYQCIREKIKDNIGEFRDFDEGMRTIDAQKFKAVRQKLDGVEKTLVRELYYSIEDFYRVSATVDEILNMIRAVLDLLYYLETRDKEILIRHQQIGTHTKDGKFISKASLIIVAYPHEYSFIPKILTIMESYEVTFSRIERIGWDLLACMVTKDDRALKGDELESLSQQVEALQKYIDEGNE